MRRGRGRWGHIIGRYRAERRASASARLIPGDWESQAVRPSCPIQGLLLIPVTQLTYLAIPQNIL